MADREPPGQRPERPTPPRVPGVGGGESGPRPPRVPGVGGSGGGRPGGGRPGSGGGPPEGQVVSQIVSPRGQTLMELWELGREDEKMTIRGRLMGRFPSLMYAYPRESGKMLGFLLRPAVLGYILSFPFLWLAETLRGEVDAERRRRAMEAMDALAALAIGALVFAALGYMATSAVEIGSALMIVGLAQLAAASVVGSPGGVLGAVSGAIGLQLVLVGATDAGLILAPLAGIPAFAAYAALGPWADARGLRAGRTLIWSVLVGGVISAGYLLLEIRNVLGTPGAAVGAVVALVFFGAFCAERYAAGESWARWGIVPFGVAATLIAIAAAAVPGDAKAVAVVVLGAAMVALGASMPSMRVISLGSAIALAAAGSGMLWTAGLEGLAATSAAVVGTVGWGSVRRLDVTGWPWGLGALAAAGAAAGGLVAGSEPLWGLAVVGGLVAGGVLGGGTDGLRGRVVPLFGAGAVLGLAGSADAVPGEGAWVALIVGLALLALAAPAPGRPLFGRRAISGPEAAGVALVVLAIRGVLGSVSLDLVAAAAITGVGVAAIAWLLGWDGAPTLLGVGVPVAVAAVGLLADLDPYAAVAVAAAVQPLARADRGEVTGGTAATVGAGATAVAAGAFWPIALGGWALVVGVQRRPENVWRVLAGLLSAGAVGAALAEPGTISAVALAAAGIGVASTPARWSEGWGAALVWGGVLAALMPRFPGASGFLVAAGPAILGLAAGVPLRRWAAVEGAAAVSLVALAWTSVVNGVSGPGALAFGVVTLVGALSWRVRPSVEVAPAGTREEGGDVSTAGATDTGRTPDGRGGFGSAADIGWITLGIAGVAAQLGGLLGPHVAGGAAAAVGIAAVLAAGMLPAESVDARSGLRIGGAVVAQGIALAWVIAGGEAAASIAAAGPLVWGALAIVEPRRSYVPPATLGVGVWAVALMSEFPVHLPRWVELGVLGVGAALAAAASAWAEGRLDRGTARTAGSVGRTVGRSIGGGVVVLAALAGAGVVLFGAAVLDPLVRAGVGDLIFRLGRWFGSFGLP